MILDKEERVPMRILLTGGCGYIGSHVAVALLRLGHSVCLYDNLSNSDISAVPRISGLGGNAAHFEEGDILDEEHLYKVLQQEEIDSVIHFAGLKSVAESVEQPALYHSVNVEGSIRLLNAMQRAEVSSLLYSSTAAVYEASQAPLKETDKLAPANPYGATKLAVERAMEAIAADAPVSFCALRYFNPVGAHESGELGENPKGRPNNLVPVMMGAVSAGKAMDVFGTDYETRDGTCIRDYIHIDDLVSGHLLALEFLQANEGYHCFNLGTKRGVSVAEMLSAFEAATGEAVPYQNAGRRPGDSAILVADPTAAGERLGWQATGSLQSMLASAWKWHCQSTKS